MKRLNSIDFTRGFVMIIMALDHVRDMIHIDSIAQSPTNLSSTTPVLFFTRWITYLCAPTFVFLAGTSAWMFSNGKVSRAEARAFLIKRGLYLLVLEFAIVNLVLFFDPGYHTLIFEVIAAIGFSFVILGLLLPVSAEVIGGFGLAILLFHDLFPVINLTGSPVLKSVLTPLFSMAAFPLNADHFLVIGYPPLPWLGIMLVGFSAGKYFLLPDQKNKRFFVKAGLIALTAFIVVRAINLYGDPFPWTHQKTGVFTFLSFMNVTKYPPSLVFCLLMLGIMFLILGLSSGVTNKFTKVVSVYGRVPLFYFLVHFFLVHVILLLVLFIQGFHWSEFAFAGGSFGRPVGVSSGLPLWAVYGIWIFVVVALYKPCQWYGEYKRANPKWWLKYL